MLNLPACGRQVSASVKTLNQAQGDFFFIDFVS